MKSLFPVSAEKILEAANLLEGRLRYKQLLEDIKDMETVGLPVFKLSTGKPLLMHVSHAEIELLVFRRLSEIEEDLDEMGVDYGV